MTCEGNCSRCFVDMDGVLVDFVEGICKAHDKPYPYADPENHGIYSLEKIWGMSKIEFWKPTTNSSFWAELPFTSDGKDILANVQDDFDLSDICLLTSPTLHPASIVGKMEWIKKNLPSFYRQVIFTPAKYLCASPGSLLIDDSHENIRAWVAHGGTGRLVIRPWNSFVPKIGKIND